MLFFFWWFNFFFFFFNFFFRFFFISRLFLRDFLFFVSVYFAFTLRGFFLLRCRERVLRIKRGNFLERSFDAIFSYSLFKS
ncbi:hypothetical protein CQA62_04530 [Helicobacter cholecystus]|uniref:Uncharacterized protein n=1 Tax=Helicobacter cholecystus TaxID=45498 RepID=A0A3D8IV49_9HELI|nr:hypothetical protein CQA62_04530 [Helicobacter cholecystus]